MFRFLASVILSLIAGSVFAQNQNSTGDCSPNIIAGGDASVNCNLGGAERPELPSEIKAILEDLDSTNDVASATGDLVGFAKRTSSSEDYALAYLTASQVQSSLGNIEIARHFLETGKERLPSSTISRLLYSEQAISIDHFGAAFEISSELFDDLVLDHTPKKALLDVAEFLIISSLKLGNTGYAREVLSKTLRVAFPDGEVLEGYRPRFEMLEARILSAEGSTEMAIRLAENALDLVMQAYGDDHFETAQAMLSSAEIHFSSGSFARSVELARGSSDTAFLIGFNPNGFHGRTSKLASQAYAALGAKTQAAELAKQHYFFAVQFQSMSDEAVFEAASFTVDILRRLGNHQDAVGILAHAFSLETDPIRIIGTEAYVNVPYFRIVAEIAAVNCAPPNENINQSLNARYLNALVALRSERLKYSFLEEAIGVMLVRREPSEIVVC